MRHSNQATDSTESQLYSLRLQRSVVHRASDRVAEQAAIASLESGAAELQLSPEARSNARELYLSALPVDERSKPAALAASCYTGALIAGEERSQTRVADVFDVSRLAIQRRWKPLLQEAGLSAPDW